MKKKIWAFFSAFVLSAALLAACGDDAAKNENDGSFVYFLINKFFYNEFIYDSFFEHKMKKTIFVFFQINTHLCKH